LGCGMSTKGTVIIKPWISMRVSAQGLRSFLFLSMLNLLSPSHKPVRFDPGDATLCNSTFAVRRSRSISCPFFSLPRTSQYVLILAMLLFAILYLLLGGARTAKLLFAILLCLFPLTLNCTLKVPWPSCFKGRRTYGSNIINSTCRSSALQADRQAGTTVIR